MNNKKRLIEGVISAAIEEQINAYGFSCPNSIDVLRQAKGFLMHAGERITEDVGRSRRLIQICKTKGKK